MKAKTEKKSLVYQINFLFICEEKKSMKDQVKQKKIFLNF